MTWYKDGATRALETHMTPNLDCDSPGFSGAEIVGTSDTWPAGCLVVTLPSSPKFGLLESWRQPNREPNSGDLYKLAVNHRSQASHQKLSLPFNSFGLFFCVVCSATFPASSTSRHQVLHYVAVLSTAPYFEPWLFYCLLARLERHSWVDLQLGF